MTDVQDPPIRIGSALFTMVDPQKGYEVAYNRWYERDHFYGGCMIGAGWFAGSRWVAPRSLKDLRFPATSPVAEPVDAGSYLSIYWMLDPMPDPGWAGRQVQWLYANGRGFANRDHVHTSIYEYLGVARRDPDGVPVELALDHHYPGLGVVAVEPADGTSRDDLADWLATDAVRALFDAGSGVDLVAQFGVMPITAVAPPPSSSPPAAGGTPAPGQPGGASLGADGGSRERVLQLAFIDGDPVAAWPDFRDYAKQIDDSGRGHVTFAAPFYATVVGTDAYADQLW
jgi:hypothetical protein